MTLDDIKNYLRVDADITEDDSLIRMVPFLFEFFRIQQRGLGFVVAHIFFNT